MVSTHGFAFSHSVFYFFEAWPLSLFAFSLGKFLDDCQVSFSVVGRKLTRVYHEKDVIVILYFRMHDHVNDEKLLQLMVGRLLPLSIYIFLFSLRKRHAWSKNGREANNKRRFVHTDEPFEAFSIIIFSFSLSTELLSNVIRLDSAAFVFRLCNCSTNQRNLFIISYFLCTFCASFLEFISSIFLLGPNDGIFAFRLLCASSEKNYIENLISLGRLTTVQQIKDQEKVNCDGKKKTFPVGNILFSSVSRFFLFGSDKMSE